MKMLFASQMPEVGVVVVVRADNFVLEARVKFRYANPVDQQIVLDLPYTPGLSLPYELRYDVKYGSWTVSMPEMCPFYESEVTVDIIG